MINNFLRFKLRGNGPAKACELVQQLFGKSQSPERASLEAIIRESSGQRFQQCRDLSFVAAVACVTTDLDIVLPQDYSWPDQLYLAGLYWKPCQLIKTPTHNNRLLSNDQPCSCFLETWTRTFLGWCKNHNVEVIGPNPPCHHIMISTDRDPSFSSLELLLNGHTLQSVNAKDILRPFTRCPKPRLYELPQTT